MPARAKLTRLVKCIYDLNKGQRARHIQWIFLSFLSLGNIGDGKQPYMLKSARIWVKLLNKQGLTRNVKCREKIISMFLNELFLFLRFSHKF